MKPFTREVLERGTEVLLQHGLSRRRRGFAVWAMSDEVQGAVTLQKRDFPDGTVRIDTYSQVYWEPVQRIYSAGLNARYRAFEQPTRSRMWSFPNFSEPDLIFAPQTVSDENLDRLSKHVEQRAIKKVLELADPTEILRFYLEEIPYGGHRPEMYLCLMAWTKRTLKLDDDFAHVISLLDNAQFIDGLNIFYEQLKDSTVAHSLISGSRT